MTCCEICNELVDDVLSYPLLDLTNPYAVEYVLNASCDANKILYGKVCESPYGIAAIGAGITLTTNGLNNSWICYLMNFCPDRCRCYE